jgi:hypothetical protein
MEERMIKIIFCLRLVSLALLGATPSFADRAIYPTYPGTNVRDYSQPGYVEKGNNIYPTLPGTDVQDVRRPGYTRKGDALYPTDPGTNVQDFKWDGGLEST